MFHEMDGSFHRDAFGSQAGRMEHPCGSGAESLMSSGRAGTRLAAQSMQPVSIRSAVPFQDLQQE